MRDRNRLEAKIKAVREVESALNDNTGLVEMGEEEGDDAIVAEAEAALEKLRDKAR